MPQARVVRSAAKEAREAGEEGLVAERADGEDFDAEEGSGERGAKDGAEAGGDAGHEEDAAVWMRKGTE